MSAVRVPGTEVPLVSVVMLTYGARRWVEAALVALVANTSPCYELIVLDNASPDGTGDWLASEVEGATVLANEKNVGFGPGVNQAALQATGRHLCLLNSDALVEPGWLPPLIEDMETVPGCGAVVPQFRNLDGTLQEAGSVVGADGRTMAMGFGDDPARPWYRFRRFVDYGSGACLLVRRSSFLALGGFDPAYGVGYYEDVDLCFGLRQSGLRIVYEPRSVVRHVRGASSPPADVVRLRDANRELFRRRWEAELGDRPSLDDLPSHPYRVAAARDVAARERILVVGCRLPPAMEDPVAELVLGLARACGEARITLIGLDDPAPAEHLADLLDGGVEVIWGVNDWDDWMSRYLCHFSVVVVADPGAAFRGAALAAAYQPDAQLVWDVRTGQGEECAALELATAGPPPVVWRRDEGAGRDALMAALAGIGVVPTGPVGWPGTARPGWEATAPAVSGGSEH